MHKIPAEIIAGLIPDKMQRNRWRGILRYGVLKTLRLRRMLRRDSTEPPVYLAICAIAKNEGPYIAEWIDWHLVHGVDKIYFYDNESTDNTRSILSPYIESGVVEYIAWPGYRMQIPAYDDCITRHRFDTRWLAFIDLDEFIVPLADGSIPAFLKRFEQFAAVEINWLTYGSGGAKEAADGPVMQRFRHHSLPDATVNRHVKSIVDPRRVCTMAGCHEAARLSGVTADSHGEPVTRNFRQRTPQQDVIRINHYAVKSLAEFMEKRGKGRASGRSRQIGLEYFRQYDLNDIKED